MDGSTVIFTLTVEDILQVIAEIFNRSSTKEEIEFVKDHVADYLPWHNAVFLCIEDYTKQKGE